MWCAKGSCARAGADLFQHQTEPVAGPSPCSVGAAVAVKLRVMREGHRLRGILRWCAIGDSSLARSRSDRSCRFCLSWRVWKHVLATGIALAWVKALRIDCECVRFVFSFLSRAMQVLVMLLMQCLRLACS